MTIIVATDFSSPAQNALNYAIEVAKDFNAKIILVNAFSVPIANYESGIPGYLIDSLVLQSENSLLQLKKSILEVHKNLKIEIYSNMGFTVDVIEAVLAKHTSDFIAMGIIGEASKIKEKFIGSVAVKVARNINIPTFIIPEKVKYNKIKKIAFAFSTDVKDNEYEYLQNVAKIALMFKAEVEFVNISNDFDNKEALMETEKNIAAIMKSIDFKFTHLKNENVAETLEDYISRNEINLVMLAPKKHNIFYDLFHESITKELAFHTHIPILTVH